MKKERRTELLELLPKNAVCAEIGVWKGEFSKQILQYATPKQLHLVDPWRFAAQFPQRWYGGLAAGCQQDMDRIYEGVVAQFWETQNVVIHRNDSVDAVKLFCDGSLDWVYIDGDHSYNAVLCDLREWNTKISWLKGGFIAGDDYDWTDESGNHSVRRAVEDFVSERGCQLELLSECQFLLKL